MNSADIISTNYYPIVGGALTNFAFVSGLNCVSGFSLPAFSFAIFKALMHPDNISIVNESTEVELIAALRASLIVSKRSSIATYYSCANTSEPSFLIWDFIPTNTINLAF